MADTARRAELAAFLRSRREALDPVTTGLQPGPRRRTPGLRREEVAQLSGVSVTWYTWLEQQRDITVSRQIVDSLARVLRLTAVERRHLLTLAGVEAPNHGPIPPVVPNSLSRLVETLEPTPACVTDPFFDLLAWNRTYSRLLGGIDHLPKAALNSLRIMFTDPAQRALLPSWSAEARKLIGQLRATIAGHPDDPRAAALIESLHDVSADFRSLWAEHPVVGFQSSGVRFDHPLVGRLILDTIKLIAAEDANLSLAVFLPADAETRERLNRL